ncbi:MAG: KOW motif-containing protein [Candidatus Pacearchaeota archaeon]
MHLTRQAAPTNLPIQRKGTKYIVRTLDNPKSSVPVLIAVRDILKLAKNAREVKKMINLKLLKINGRVVRDYHETIKLFNIFDADKSYFLSLLPTGKFFFKEAKNSSSRLCKIMGKTNLPKNIIQFNLHDGSNIISKEKFNIGDTLIIDFSNKIKQHIPLEKGRHVLVISGKNIGLEGKVLEVKDKKALIKFRDKEVAVELSTSQVIAYE